MVGDEPAIELDVVWKAGKNLEPDWPLFHGYTMEVEGNPLAKRSKWSGSKRVLRCTACGTRKVVPSGKEKHSCSCGKRMKDILIPVMDHGKQILRSDSPADLRKTVLMSIKNLELE